ncbi:MAG: ABC transporter ATP-binding protein [Rhodobacteraceae bacterium]|nr:ABC transporter ATP-binding protein [Paracoccaceae bacterium]
MGKTKLAISGVSKTYGAGPTAVAALDNISIDIAEGDFVSVVGPSGCGKTTLLWIIAGLQDATRGTLSLDGQGLSGPNPQIGMMFQEANLLPWKTVRQNVELPFEIRKQPVPHERIDMLLQRVGLDEFGDSMPRELSGGMQQRAAIVRALAPDPDVLLMDEPFGALDAFTRDEMNILIEEIWMETGKTVILITHSIEEAVFLSNKVHVFSARPGRLERTVDVPFARKRTFGLIRTQPFFEMVNEIKAVIRDERNDSASNSKKAKVA